MAKEQYTCAAIMTAGGLSLHEGIYDAAWYIIKAKVRGRTAVGLKTSLKAFTPKGDGTHFSLA
jgi:hypothetical protein